MAEDTGLKKDPGEVKAQVGAEPTPNKKEPEPKVEGTVKAEPEPKGTEGELPESVSERTREQFDKLKGSNQRLLKANQVLQGELTKKYRSEQTFAPIQQASAQQPPAVQQPPATQPPVPQTQAIQPPAVEKFIETDPITGEQYVNEAKLRSAITDANTRAVKAETAVRNYILQQQAVEEEQQTRDAYKAHPALNPEVKDFDKELHRRTRSVLLDSMMNPSDYDGHALTFKEAADFATEQSTKDAKKLEKKVEGERQGALEKKEQASLAAEGQTGTPPPPKAVSEEHAELIQRTRLGDPWALAQRLQNAPHAGTPTSPEARGESEEKK